MWRVRTGTESRGRRPTDTTGEEEVPIVPLSPRGPSGPHFPRFPPGPGAPGFPLGHSGRTGTESRGETRRRNVELLLVPPSRGPDIRPRGRPFRVGPGVGGFFTWAWWGALGGLDLNLHFGSVQEVPQGIWVVVDGSRRTLPTRPGQGHDW